MGYDKKPLLLCTSAEDTFPETASQLNASTLGGAKPNQTRTLEDLSGDSFFVTLENDLDEKRLDGQ